MKVILCVDNDMGIAFNHRRQSRDSALTADVIKTAEGSRLMMNAYSRKLFDGYDDAGITVDEDFLQDAEDDDYCFVELTDVAGFADRISELIIYRWNRDYPADTYLTLDMKGYEPVSSEDIEGTSHVLTKEVYEKI